eukprot:g5189.t1
MDGTTFAGLIISFMIANESGPSEEEGKLLLFAHDQGTSANERDTSSGLTPIEYASQRRLILWLRFIIDRLRVRDPAITTAAIAKFRAKDRRKLTEMSDPDDRDKYTRAYTCLDLPHTVEFLDELYQRQSVQTDQELDWDDPPREMTKLGAWMMMRSVGSATFEAYGGGLYALYTVCLRFAQAVNRWARFPEHKITWQAFAEAHRGLVDSARTLIALADVPSEEQDMAASNSLKKSLREWIASVLNVVQKLCEEMEEAVANPQATHNELQKHMMKSTAEILEKRAQINLQLERTRTTFTGNPVIGNIDTASLKEELASRFELDKKVKAARGILSQDSSNEKELRQALQDVLTTLVEHRREKKRHRFSADPTAASVSSSSSNDGRSPGPGGGVRETKGAN